MWARAKVLPCPSPWINTDSLSDAGWREQQGPPLTCVEAGIISFLLEDALGLRVESEPQADGKDRDPGKLQDTQDVGVSLAAGDMVVSRGAALGLCPSPGTWQQQQPGWGGDRGSCHLLKITTSGE